MGIIREELMEPNLLRPVPWNFFKSSLKWGVEIQVLAEVSIKNTSVCCCISSL